MAEYQDYMIRAIAANDEIRAKAHNTSPLATAALGRTMSAAVMMNDMLKNEDDLLTLQFNGDGPLGQITVTADHHGNVKGFVQHTDVELPLKADGHLDVGRGVGKGTLTVIRDLDDGKTYNGQVEIHSGEIADDIGAGAFLGRTWRSCRYRPHGPQGGRLHHSADAVYE